MSRRLDFELTPKPPFRLDLTVWALRRRPSNVVDRWEGEAYRRVFQIGKRAIGVAVVQHGSAGRSKLAVSADGAVPGDVSEISGILGRMLGLASDLTAFYRIARRQEPFDSLARRFRGFKPPRFPTVFEALVNGIACQQVSLDVGILLMSRLAQTYGPSRGGRSGFPSPKAVSALDAPDLRALGFSMNKSRALIGIAQSIQTGNFRPEEMETMETDSAAETLLSLSGVGPWTADYVLLRGLGRLSTFPGNDAGARNRLAKILKTRSPLPESRVRKLARAWHPYAGLVYFHLLLSGLAERGAVESGP